MPTTTASDEDKHRSLRFTKALNEHGYAFQEAVRKRVEDLRFTKKSLWREEAPEFPVAVQNRGTRIDPILSPQKEDYPCLDILQLCECKRANPAYSHWCFSRAPFSRRRGRPERMIVEATTFNDPMKGVFRTTGKVLDHSIDVRAAHVAIELKTDDKGNESFFRERARSKRQQHRP